MSTAGPPSVACEAAWTLTYDDENFEPVTLVVTTTGWSDVRIRVARDHDVIVLVPAPGELDEKDAIGVTDWLADAIRQAAAWRHPGSAGAS